MKKVKLSKLLIANLTSMSCYLTKMEMLLISTLFITSCSAVKMEMQLAETKFLHSQPILIENSVIHNDSEIVLQSIVILEKGFEQAPENLRFKAELPLNYFVGENYAKTNILAKQVLAEKGYSEVIYDNILDFIARI